MGSKENILVFLYFNKNMYYKCFPLLKGIWIVFLSHVSSVHILQSNQSVFKFLLDLASKEKERLEEKQRAARKERAKDEAEWQTR